MQADLNTMNTRLGDLLLLWRMLLAGRRLAGIDRPQRRCRRDGHGGHGTEGAALHEPLQGRSCSSLQERHAAKQAAAGCAHASRLESQQSRTRFAMVAEHHRRRRRPTDTCGRPPTAARLPPAAGSAVYQVQAATVAGRAGSWAVYRARARGRRGSQVGGPCRPVSRALRGSQVPHFASRPRCGLLERGREGNPANVDQ